MLEVRIKEVAQSQNLTISELAAKAGVAYNTVSSLWRGGVSRVDLPVLAKIAGALGVRSKDLLVEPGEENTTPKAA